MRHCSPGQICRRPIRNTFPTSDKFPDVSALHQDPAPCPLHTLFKSNGATTRACRWRAPKVGFRTPESANVAVYAYATDSSGFDAPKGAPDSKGATAADGTRAGTRTGSSARTAPGEASAAASDSNEASGAGTGSSARTAPGEASSAASDSNETSAAGSTGSGTGVGTHARAAPGTGAAAADGTEKLGGCHCGGGYGGGIGTRAGRAAVADGFKEGGDVGQQQLDAPCGTDSGGGDSRDRRDVGGRCGANDGECSDGFGF